MEKYRRKNFITRKGYQLKFTAVIILSMLFITIFTVSMLYFDIYRVFSPDELSELIRWDIYFIRAGILLVAVSAAGIFLSHKNIGPIHRIYDALYSINEGEFDLNLTLRNGDDFNKISEEILRLAAALEEVSNKIPELPLEIASYQAPLKGGENPDA